MAAKLIPNALWLQIARQVLEGDTVARARLQQQVQFYVRYQLGAPLCHVVRADQLHGLATQVIQLISAHDDAALRMWVARQAQQLDPSPWWTWIEVVARFAMRSRAGAQLPRLASATVSSDPARALGQLRSFNRRRAAHLDDPRPATTQADAAPALADGTNARGYPQHGAK